VARVGRQVAIRLRLRSRVKLVALLAASSALVSPAFADDHLIYNTYGNVGMIDMPSARMAPDGRLSMGASFQNTLERFNLGFQAFPWLEASFRYTGLQHFEAGVPVYWDRSFALKARLMQETSILPAIAIGVNDLIGTGVYSGEYVVASKRIGPFDASIGLGWGRFGSYKPFRNPLSLISSSFDHRGGAYNTTGDIPGSANFGVFFHGPASLFGGVTWNTPIDGLSVIAEYSSDAYELEASANTYAPKNPFNFGVSYQVTNSINAGLDWLYGNTLAGHFSIALDAAINSFPDRFGEPPINPQVRSRDEQTSAIEVLRGRRPSSSRALAAVDMVDQIWTADSNIVSATLDGKRLNLSLSRGDVRAACRKAAALAAQPSADIELVNVSVANRTAQCAVTPVASPAAYRVEAVRAELPVSNGKLLMIDASTNAVERKSLSEIRADAARQGIRIIALQANAGVLIAYYENDTYFKEREALDRIVRLLMSEAPREIEKFRLINVENGVPQREFDVLRAPVERDYDFMADLNLAQNLVSVPAPMRNPVLAAENRLTYPNFSWDVSPQLRQSLFDPNEPLGIQLLAAASGTVNILPGLSATLELETNLFSTVSTTRTSDSVLPHVRTDFLEYLKHGATGIGYFDAEYRFRLAPDVFGIVKAGYLETMFAGVGGELLWRPEGRRWAIGADLYGVQQRDFDRLLGLRNYNAVTGHISLYYASPWYDLQFAMRAGQYLAGDRGLTFEMSRRFSTGVEIGAFMTTTNVSAKDFGEGSFDKGIIIRIPIEWITPVHSQSQLRYDLRPIQRDGGQRLLGDTVLYGETYRTSPAEMDIMRY
jgi:hypothetical protein